jgi:glucose-6-phosphate 1-epimerase
MQAKALPCIDLRHASGDCARVSLFGGQVLSWAASGQERFFLSPKAVMDGSAPIRGGVPVCFPQFNQRGSLPKHGFARTMHWQVRQAPHTLPSAQVQAVLAFTDTEATRAIWPHAFELALTVTLGQGALDLHVDVCNTGDAPFEFACALHSYLAIGGLAHTELQGLEQASYWNAVTDEHPAPDGLPLRFTAQCDRVYTTPSQPIGLLSRTSSGQPTALHITNSERFSETVVWNPHAALCAQLPDMAADGYEHMLCVEAAKLLEKVQLPAGKVWSGQQSLVLASTIDPC